MEKKTISHKIAWHITRFCYVPCILCFVAVQPPHNDLHNEKDLIRLLAGDDEIAFRELFERYSDNIFGVALAYTKSRDIAEEIVQDGDDLPGHGPGQQFKTAQSEGDRGEEHHHHPPPELRAFE